MKVAKSERLHICLFGRTNVGKSSIINFITGQNVSIVSQIAGTTTDVVEKTMELAEIGAIVLIDTAGIDDNSELGVERKKRTLQIFQKCDFAFLVVEPNIWTEFEDEMIENFRKNNIKFAIIINKTDLMVNDEWLMVNGGLNHGLNRLNDCTDYSSTVFANEVKQTTNNINRLPRYARNDGQRKNARNDGSGNNNNNPVNPLISVISDSDNSINHLPLTIYHSKHCNREEFLNKFKQIISKEIVQNEKTLLENLIQKNDVCLFVTPIDSGAPKGRLIMPQVQTIRDSLDKNAISIIVQTDEYLQALNSLKIPPKLVICDSQVVKKVIEISNAEQQITTFSILFSRLKGDFNFEIAGAYSLEKILKNDKILIAEACSHHSQKDDIATIRIPKLLEKYFKENGKSFVPIIEYSKGRDFPENLAEYKLIIHCGGCMLTDKEKSERIKQAKNLNIPFTNFGMIISFLNGYLDRVLKPFEV